jgi:Transcriptional regulator
MKHCNYFICLIICGYIRDTVRISYPQKCHVGVECMSDKPISSRKQQALETKARIYQTALSLMEKKNYQSITIEEISKSAGVSVGAFYHYFKSKNEFFSKFTRKQIATLKSMSLLNCRRRRVCRGSWNILRTMPVIVSEWVWIP